MFIPALFTLNQKAGTAKRPSTDEEINTMWTTYGMIPFLWSVQNRKIHRNTKEMSDCLELRAGGIGEWLPMGHGVSPRGDWKRSERRQWRWLDNTVNVINVTKLNTLKLQILYYVSVQLLSRVLWDSMDCSTPGFPVHHQLLELAQTHVHQVGDAIQPSHPLSSPSPPALNLSQHQGLFKWVSYSH